METEQKNSKVALSQSNFTDPVILHVKELKASNMLDLPADYSALNALNAAFYILKNDVQVGDKSALEVCSKENIVHVLKEMVIEGLNPAKKQCYFAVMKGILKRLPSYYGDQAKAKRFGNLVQEVIANIVYESDEFETEIDLNTGFEKLKKHIRGNSRDMKKISGAYAIAKSPGRDWFEYMDIAAIKRAWARGLQLMKKQDSTVQRDFTDRAAKRTVIRRLCNDIYFTSNDSYVLENLSLKEDFEEPIAIDSIQENKVIELPEQKKDNEIIEPKKAEPKKTESKQSTLDGFD